MSSFESPSATEDQHGKNPDNGSRVLFESGGASVDARAFDPVENPDTVGMAAEHIQRGEELARADRIRDSIVAGAMDGEATSDSGIGIEDGGVTDSDFVPVRLGEIRTMTGEVMAAVSSESGEEEPGDNNYLSLLERFPKARRALSMLILSGVLSGMATEASAATSVFDREIDRSTQTAKRDAGRAVGTKIERFFSGVRKVVGLQTPAEERQEAVKARQEEMMRKRTEAAQARAENTKRSVEQKYDNAAVDMWNKFVEEVVSPNKHTKNADDAARVSESGRKYLVRLQKLDSDYADKLGLKLSPKGQIYQEAIKRVMDGKITVDQLVKDQRSALVSVENDLFPANESQPVQSVAGSERQESGSQASQTNQSSAAVEKPVSTGWDSGVPDYSSGDTKNTQKGNGTESIDSIDAKYRF